MPTVTRLAWPEFMTLTGNLAERLAEDGGPPDFLIGIARGGLPLLAALASYFKVSDVGVAFVRSTVTDDPFAMRLPRVECRCLALPGGIEGRSVVIADDIIRSGRTVRAVLAGLGPGARSSVRVASLYAEPGTAGFSHQSARVAEPDRWILFPWDDWPQGRD